MSASTWREEGKGEGLELSGNRLPYKSNVILRHSCRLFNIGKLLGNLEDDKIFQRTSLVIETSLVGTHADQDNSDNDLEGTVSKQSTHTDQAMMT